MAKTAKEGKHLEIRIRHLDSLPLWVYTRIQGGWGGREGNLCAKQNHLECLKPTHQNRMGKGIWKNCFKRAEELQLCHTIIFPPLLGNSMKQIHFLPFSESLGTQSSRHLFKCSDFQKSKWGKKGLLRIRQIQAS